MSTTTIQQNTLYGLGEGANVANATWLTNALRWANTGYHDMQLRHAWKCFKRRQYFSTVASQAAYQYPSNWIGYVTTRDDTNEQIIEELSAEEFDRQHTDPSTETTGKPTQMCIEFDSTNRLYAVRFAPIPDDAYVFYSMNFIIPSDLSGSVSPIYGGWEHALERGGIYYGSLELLEGNDPKIAIFKQNFETAIAALIKMDVNIGKKRRYMKLIHSKSDFTGH